MAYAKGHRADPLGRLQPAQHHGLQAREAEAEGCLRCQTAISLRTIGLIIWISIGVATVAGLVKTVTLLGRSGVRSPVHAIIVVFGVTALMTVIRRLLISKA